MKLSGFVEFWVVIILVTNISGVKIKPNIQLYELLMTSMGPQMVLK
jgi:hypothetical protein